MNQANIENNFEYRFNPNEIDISLQQISLYYLLKRLENNEIDLFPEYQRHWNLWDKVKQSRLIESILIRIPIPSFYFDSGIEGKWQVVDGLQRVTTFYNYIIKNAFKLEGLEFLPQFNGFLFTELPRELQRRIEEFSLSIYLINRGTPEEIKFIIFSRINTGGINLNNQELRYALNQGKATRFLVELSNLPDFLEATNYSIRPKRMNDYEYINRFLAFYLNYDEYYGNLETFMSKILFTLNQGLGDFEKIRSEFIKSMNYSIRIFESLRFKKIEDNKRSKGRINKSLFDTISVNLAWLSIPELEKLVLMRDEIIISLLILFDDREFVESISFSTNSRRKVNYRFETIKYLFKSQLND